MQPQYAINLNIQTQENKFHTFRPHTDGDKRRLKKKILKAKVFRILGIYADLAKFSQHEQAPYIRANVNDFETLH